MILMLTQDLMMSANVSSVARANDEPFKTAGTLAAALKVLATGEPRLLLVDLQMPGLDVAQLAHDLSELPEAQRPRSVAYAQHVNKELLEQADQAGFDQILTRGQMHNNVADVLLAK